MASSSTHPEPPPGPPRSMSQASGQSTYTMAPEYPVASEHGNSTSTVTQEHMDEARDKVPEIDETFGVPPSRARSPGSPVRHTGALGAGAAITPNGTNGGNDYGFPHVQRSATRDSRLSRISSRLPNHEKVLAEGPEPRPAPPPHLKKYAYHFFSPEIAFYRKIVIKILVMMCVLTTFIMWSCAPLYWGSLWKSNTYTHRLAVRVIDRDGGEIGQAVSSFLLNQTDLHYFVTPPEELPTLAAVEHDMVQEGAWGAIVITTGASDILKSSRASGNSSYDPREAIQFVYAQARNEQATGTYLVPLVTAALQKVTGMVSAKSVSEFLPTVAGNVTALEALARAPQTLSNPVAFTSINVRPYNQPVANAITLVGLIYMLIFSFICTMANSGAREIIAPYLTTRAYLTYRILAPFFLYFVLSFMFAMVSLPFKVHFGAHFSYAGGFFFWWFILLLGMSALGLSTEFMITIVGPKFVSFFLIPLIISNVSVVALPHELQPGIFRYGVAMPFYNCSRAIRTLIFDTKNELGKNCGILLGWIGVSIITICLATWLFRRKSVNEHKRSLGSEEFDHKLPDNRVV